MAYVAENRSLLDSIENRHEIPEARVRQLEGEIAQYEQRVGRWYLKREEEMMQLQPLKEIYEQLQLLLVQSEQKRSALTEMHTNIQSLIVQIEAQMARFGGSFGAENTSFESAFLAKRSLLEKVSIF